MRSRLLAALVVSVGFAALSAPVAHAQDEAAADLAFWQSIQADKDPAEYKAYLSAFPNGRFAALARLRITGKPVADEEAAPQAPVATPKPVGTAQAPKPAPAQAQAQGQDEPEEDPVLPEQIEVSPTRGRVGQLFQFTCVNFPDPSSFDKIVVVPAGTPEMDPTRSPQDTKVLWSTYARSCKDGPAKGGPFPPGQYEVRYMTVLYNSENRYEVHARAPLTVR